LNGCGGDDYDICCGVGSGYGGCGLW
jgi:hypothetical protein